MRPTVQQIRREFDRRTSPSRKYTPCKGIKHKLIQLRLRRYPTEDLKRMVMRSQNRLDVPSALVDPCVCGGLKPINRWG